MSNYGGITKSMSTMSMPTRKLVFKENGFY